MKNVSVAGQFSKASSMAFFQPGTGLLPVPPHCIFCGHLQKKKVKGGKFYLGRQWRRRFFVLWDTGLEYFTDQTMAERKGFMYIKDVSKWSGQGKRYGMELMTIDQTLYRLCADNEQEQDDWIAKLHLVCDMVNASGDLSYSLSETGTLFAPSATRIDTFLPFKGKVFFWGGGESSNSSPSVSSPAVSSPAVRASGSQPLRRLSELTPISFGTLHPSISGSLGVDAERYIRLGGVKAVEFGSDETGLHLASMWEWCQIETGDGNQEGICPRPSTSLQPQLTAVGSIEFDDDDGEDEGAHREILQVRTKMIEFFKELIRKLEGNNINLTDAFIVHDDKAIRNDEDIARTACESYSEYKKLLVVHDGKTIRIEEDIASTTCESNMEYKEKIDATTIAEAELVPQRSVEDNADRPVLQKKLSAGTALAVANISTELTEGLPTDVLEELGHFMEYLVEAPENISVKYAAPNGLTITKALDQLLAKGTMEDSAGVGDALKLLSEAVVIFRATHLAVQWHQCRSVLYYVVPHTIKLLHCTAASCVSFLDTPPMEDPSHKAVSLVRPLLYWSLGIAAMLTNASPHSHRVRKMLGSHFRSYPPLAVDSSRKREVGSGSGSKQKRRSGTKSNVSSDETGSSWIDWDDYLMARSFSQFKSSDRIFYSVYLYTFHELDSSFSPLNARIFSLRSPNHAGTHPF